jgi:hypothetical protein
MVNEDRIEFALGARLTRTCFRTAQRSLGGSKIASMATKMHFSLNQESALDILALRRAPELLTRIPISSGIQQPWCQICG